jgi:hypothetical protein
MKTCHIFHKHVPWTPGRMKPINHWKPSLDHIVPVNQPDFVNFGHVRTNVRLAHLICNIRRSRKGIYAQYLLLG